MIVPHVPTDRLGADWPRSAGLTARGALDAHQRYGPNDIVEAVEHPWWALARDTARDPMIWFFAGTSTLYGFVGQIAEAATLLGAIVPLVLMDVFLHRRTQASTEGLKSRLASRATVVRDGTPIEVAARDVVPGDLATVMTGETFPADGVVLTGADLQVDESSLTGESYPVRKRPVTAPAHASDEPRVGHEQWVFAGTRLLTGRASLVVAYTGSESIYGEIVRSAKGTAQTRTPLQQAIQGLVVALSTAALVLCAILIVVRLRQGHGWLDATISAVTLATAALPEEFPVVFAFFLGVGVYRLARSGALVRRAVSVENIGRVSCICSDKTGTITEGNLRIAHLVPVESTDAAGLLTIAAAASRRESGDPLDTAIFVRVDQEPLRAAALAERVATFPFTEDRKRETAVERDERGQILAYTKGAAEIVLSLVSLSPAERQRWGDQVSTLAESGHKVIACAWQLLDGAWTGAEPASDFRLAGLLAFEDPVRDGVAAAVAACQAAGIHIIVVTGDHPVTARAIALEIGLGGAASQVISGEQMQAVIDGGESATLRHVHVIARAAPAQKLALVRALQARGEIVAVTGDGVNDVPALQAADIGVAMGERGTRSAREVASIVLLDDNFRTIVQAISEGRQLFRNLQLSFEYILMIHIPLVITAALIPLAGYPLLYLPTHIVWLEMLIHPTALLVFQGLPSPDGFESVDRRRAVQFFSRLEWLLIGVVGALMTILVTVGYLRSFATGDVDHGRAMALAVLTLSSATLTAALSRFRTTASRVIVAGSMGLSLVLTQVPSLASALHLEPLHADDWAIAGIGSLLVGVFPLLFDYGRAPRRHVGRGGRPGPRLLPTPAPSVGKS
jgi:P-type Ca2+ transporter type 2C